MPNILQLAPSVGSVSPTLDLNAAGIGLFQLMANPEPKFDPPPLRRATAGTLLSDGLRQPAAAFDNRTITFTLRLLSGTQAQKQTALGALYQELNKLAPVLRLQYSDASTSTWYRLLRSPANPIRRIRADGRALLVDVELLAEPFGYGLPVILPIVTVNDDPAAAGNAMCLDVDSTAAVANANPYFETDVSSWSGINGAALSRTTAQFHQGIAAMRLTPDGITAAPRAQSEQIAVAAGASVYAQAWLRSPGATPTVGMTIRWYSDAAGTVFLSKSGSPSLVLVSSTWTFSAVSDAAPATAVSYRLAPEYSGTPTAGTLLDVDEALGGPSDGAVGDVETPLSFSLPAGEVRRPSQN